MFTISAGGGNCGEGQWAVLDGDGNQVGDCFDSEADAQAECDRLNMEAEGGGEENAGAGEQLADSSAAEWHAWVLPGDLPSTDGREFASEGGGWRDLPLPAMLMTTNDWGHDGARAAALATLMEWRDGMIYAEGTYNQTPEGEELRGYVERQELRWVSADVADVGEVELYELMPDGSEQPYTVPDLLFFGEEGGQQARGRGPRMHDEAAEEESGRIIERYMSWNVMGLTVLPFPAFPQCVIAPIDVPLPDAAAAGQDAAAGLGMASNASRPLTAAASAPVAPPQEWFADPAFGEPGEDPRLVHDPELDLWACPLQVDGEGRVFGHLAPWEECFLGNPGVCMTAPTSRTNYAYFLTGEIETAEGETIPCGQITLQGGHPDLAHGYERAQAAYADTRSAVADVMVGEDAYGVWLAGALRPGVTEEQLRVLRASALSGDWRPIGTGLELIAAVCVNSPGFPIPRRTAHVASAGGRQTALVAAGTAAMSRLRGTLPVHSALADVQRRLAILEARTEPLRAMAAAAMRDSVGRGVHHAAD